MTTTNLKKKIKEVNNYFVAKILAGDFEVNKVQDDKFFIKITIDGEFSFNMWMYCGMDMLTTHSGIITLYFTKEEKALIYSLLIDEYKNVEKSIKRAEFEKLKAELEIN